MVGGFGEGVLDVHGAGLEGRVGETLYRGG